MDRTHILVLFDVYEAREPGFQQAYSMFMIKNSSQTVTHMTHYCLIYDTSTSERIIKAYYLKPRSVHTDRSVWKTDN